MKNLGLKLLVVKAMMMLTSKRSKRVYLAPRFYLQRIELELKREIKYLVIILNKTLGFKQHLKAAATKASAIAAVIYRLMSIIGGSTQRKKQVGTYFGRLCTVSYYMLLPYGL